MSCSTGKPSTFYSNLIIICNCFLYSYHYRCYNDPNYPTNMIQNSFLASSNIIFDGMFYFLCAKFISNFYQPFSSSIFTAMIKHLQCSIYLIF